MDIMSPEKRSTLVSCTRARDRGIEKAVQEILQQLNMQHEARVRESLGTPGFALGEVRRAGLDDGDFRPGSRLPKREHELAASGATRLPRNRRRVRYKSSKLPQRDWTVLGLREHDIEQRPTWRAQHLDSVAGLRDPYAVTEPAR